MGNCEGCRFWRPRYLDSSEAGWRSKMLMEAGFGGCTLFDDRIKIDGLSDPDIAAQVEDGAFISGSSAILITHSSFGCNRWRVKLGRKRKVKNER